MALKYCSDVIPGFCESQKGDIDSACHEESKEAGKHIMWHPEKGVTCWCVCSCLGGGTEITVEGGGEIPIEKVSEGKTKALAAGIGLEFIPTVVHQVSQAAPGKTENTIHLAYTAAGKVRDLVLTIEHPVLVRTRAGETKIVAAVNLQLDDQLLDRAGNPVTINDIHWGGYESGFWEFATVMEKPNERYDGHLVVTGGIVTGDFAVATFVDYPFGLGSIDDTAEPDRPLVGSSRWRERNGYVEADAPIEVHGAQFIPAELHRVEVPAHASAFLPAMQAARLEEDPEVPKRPITDQYFLEECEWLIDKVFKPLFPDVTFLFDWYSDTVNAASWVDVEDKTKKYVYLSGGLSRIDGFDYEGMALALAHEIGHLRGKPVMRDGVTCEGEADWYGALNVMRMLWFGEYYFEYTERALDQLKTLYKYLEPAGDEPLTDAFGDRYPSNDCRIETIETAMRSPKIPKCAECVPQEEPPA